MFSTLPKTKIIVVSTFILSSANALNLNQSKNLLFGKHLPVIGIKLNTLQNFRLLQIVGGGKQQNKWHLKQEILLSWDGRGEYKHYSLEYYNLGEISLVQGP